MKLFVTGGAGFIGSNFIRYVLKSKRNYSVVNSGDFLGAHGGEIRIPIRESHTEFTRRRPVRAFKLRCLGLER
jgi:dTDP-glucose 4,6-dehydratase